MWAASVVGPSSSATAATCGKTLESISIESRLLRNAERVEGVRPRRCCCRRPRKPQSVGIEITRSCEASYLALPLAFWLLSGNTTAFELHSGIISVKVIVQFASKAFPKKHAVWELAEEREVLGSFTRVKLVTCNL